MRGDSDDSGSMDDDAEVKDQGSTNCITQVLDEEGDLLVMFDRQFDSYPDMHGKVVASFLQAVTRRKPPAHFNGFRGMDDLAAQVLSHVKSGPYKGLYDESGESFSEDDDAHGMFGNITIVLAKKAVEMYKAYCTTGGTMGRKYVYTIYFKDSQLQLKIEHRNETMVDERVAVFDGPPCAFDEVWVMEAVKNIPDDWDATRLGEAQAGVKSEYPAWAPDKPPKRKVGSPKSQPTLVKENEKEKEKDVPFKEVVETVVGDGAASSDDEEEETKGRMIPGGEAVREGTPPRERYTRAAASPQKSPKKSAAGGMDVKVKEERERVLMRSPLRQARDAGIVRYSPCADASGSKGPVRKKANAKRSSAVKEENEEGSARKRGRPSKSRSPGIMKEAQVLGSAAARKGGTVYAGDEDVYTVESLIGMRREVGGKREFLVKWKGYSRGEATWEPEKNISPDVVVYYGY